jgi:hypothetical protein
VLCLELQYICIIGWCICDVTFGLVCGFPVCWVVDALSCCPAILVSVLECVRDVSATGQRPMWTTALQEEQRTLYRHT